MSAAQIVYQILFAAFAFLLGSCVGSFLNVCIYRLPLDLSVNEPKRSFCPICKYQIPWTSNLPLITWLVQRGKCKNCNAPIPIRYFLVELLTGLLFLAVWWRAGYAYPYFAPAFLPHTLLFVPWAVFVSLLIVATFIDFEHYIIPDGITWGGAVTGIVLSLALPSMHGEKLGEMMGHLRSAGWSLAGAALGFGLLWAVSFFGKLAFGKKTRVLKKSTPFTWTHDMETHDCFLTIGEDKEKWEDLFPSEKHFIDLECESFVFDGKTYENLTVHSQYLNLHLDGKVHDLQTTKFFSGNVSKLTFRRDAMGFGDVKFMACIGAFLGWKAVLFAVFAASLFGVVVSTISIALGRREWSAKIPFGPYLSLGALLWMFAGPELVNWYWSWAFPPQEVVGSLRSCRAVVASLGL